MLGGKDMESTKNSDVRINNRKRVVNTLFRGGPLTKQDLALKLDISLPTVTLLLKELTNKGLIEKGDILQSTGGRKPVCIAPVYNAKYAIGAEVSMYEFRLVLVDLGANVLARESHPLGIQNTEQYWQQLNTILMDFIDCNVEEKDKLLDVGITLQVSIQDGAIIPKKNLPSRCIVDLNMAASCFSIPIKFYNSAKAAAIAQVWSLNDRENFTFVSLGSYIGGAMIYDGVIMDFMGANGEFGRIVIADRQRKMDDCCTANSLCERAGVERLSEVFEQIELGNESISKIWDEYLDILSVFLHNLYSIFGWKIVLGGSMSPYLDRYQDRIKQRLFALSDFEEDETMFFEVSDLGKFGAAVGAALLPTDEFLEFGYDEL